MKEIIFCFVGMFSMMHCLLRCAAKFSAEYFLSLCRMMAICVSVVLFCGCEGAASTSSSNGNPSDVASLSSNSSLSIIGSSSSLFTSSSSSGGEALVSILSSDGEFSTGAEGFDIHIAGVGNTASFNGEAYFTVTQRSMDMWDVQMTHPISLSMGIQYSLCFHAISDEVRTISIDFDTDAPNYESLTGGDIVELTTKWAAYEYQFETSASIINGRLTFNLGSLDSPTNVALDNIGVYQGSVCPNIPLNEGVSSSSSSSSSSTSSSSSSSSTGMSSSGGGGVFVHPGAVNNKADLEYVKSMIDAGAEPWSSQFTRLLNYAVASDRNSAPRDEGGQQTDGHRAYANALAWHYSNDSTYAENAITILNYWGSTFTGYGAPEGQNLLQGAWIGSLLGPAAELMRDYDGWAPSDLAQVQTMFRDAFYPVLNTMSTWNGNVDLTQIEAMLSIAVFNEDADEFALAIQRLESRLPAYFYMDTDPASARNYGGSTDGSWFNAEWVNGVTQETCRDNNHHAQFAMGAAFHALEVLYNQGYLDIVNAQTDRMVSTIELMARQQLTGSMQGVCVNNTPTTDLYNTWQAGYNLYANRMGLDLSNTLELINSQVRDRGANVWNLVFETLSHHIE